MGTKISDFFELQLFTGEEEAVLALNGVNYKFKLKNIKTLISKQDLQIDKVDNTSDADKPISVLTQEALDGKAPTQHNHTVGQVEGLSQALADKAAAEHTHTIDQVQDLSEALDNIGTALSRKADVEHTHTPEQVEGLDEEIRTVVGTMSGVGDVIVADPEW